MGPGIHISIVLQQLFFGSIDVHQPFMNICKLYRSAKIAQAVNVAIKNWIGKLLLSWL